MERKRNVSRSSRAFSTFLIVMAVTCAGGCRKGDQGSARAGFASGSAEASAENQGGIIDRDKKPPDTDLAGFFDSIGPALPGDFNGDGTLDTARGVHVRSSGSMDQAPFRTVTLDTTSPYEDLCRGWGLFLVLRKQGGSADRIYLCGQQARVQDLSWVGAARLDTLPFAELKAKAGKGVNDVLTLFSQAGITVYLYFDGAEFRIYEPDEEP